MPVGNENYFSTTYVTKHKTKANNMNKQAPQN